MNIQLSPTKAAKSARRIFAVLLTASLITASFTFENVSAYYTAGANGRSLEVVSGFTVNEMLAPAGSACRELQMLRSFTGVTIHETSNWLSGANARMHALYLRDGGRNNDVSWHYAVDSTTAYQCIPESEKSWHAGDTANGKGNASTISIEICDNRDGNFDQAMANAEWLAADVLYRHGVFNVSGALFQHHDFSVFGKNCPITIRDTGRWGEFCGKTQRYLDQMVSYGGTYKVTKSGSDVVISGTPSSSASASGIDIYADNYRFVGTCYVENGTFSFSLDDFIFTAGWHVFRIAVLRNDGRVMWINQSFRLGAEPMIFLDSPSGGLIYGEMEISGWAVSFPGVSNIDIYLDDYKWVGSTSGMTERWDVNNQVNTESQYKDAVHSGFSYTMDTSMLTEGNHVIRVAAVSKDGNAQWTAKTFTIGSKSAMYLDSPAKDGNYGDIAVSGWAVSIRGIARIDLYYDNNIFLGSTSDMSERWDVNNQVNTNGQYKDAVHSGFSYTIDASILSVGSHRIKVAAISNDGTVQWTEKTINVGSAPQIFLDSPADNAAAGSDISVSGWAVSNSGISGIDLYADDNIWIGSTTNIYERWDVNNSINSGNQYKDALHSGFTYTIDKSILNAGIHIIRVAAISKDGSVQWIAKRIVIN